MEFAEDDEISSIRDMMRRFVAKECPPDNSWEGESRREILRGISAKFGELGICGLCVPEEYGGMGRRVIALSVAMEELARASVTLLTLFQMSASYGALNVSEFGTEEQRASLLPGLLEGRILFCYGLSEPDIGADLSRVKTTVRRSGDRITVNGAKRWITEASTADYIYALVRSGPVDAVRKNLTFVLVPTDAPGVTITKLPTMGSGSTYDVILDNVELPFDHVMGGEAGWNNGWSMLAGPSLEIEKLSPITMALGIAEAAVAEAWTYSQERVQGGKLICGHQTVRHALCDAQTNLQACRLMAHYAATMVENGKNSATATSMAKLFVCEMAKDIVLSCQQDVMGAYGYGEGYAMERYVRDILQGPIVGGSSAVQRNNIANLMNLPKG